VALSDHIARVTGASKRKNNLLCYIYVGLIDIRTIQFIYGVIAKLRISVQFTQGFYKTVLYLT